MTSHERHNRTQFRLKRPGPHVMSALQVWLWLLLFVFQNEFRIAISIQPGYLDFDNLPDTNFSCVGKVIGGYYADLETSCQMFHVCTIGQQEEPMDIKFLCLNGTVFDQETRVCERVDEVDCSKSERFYSLNLELYGNTAPPFIKPESADSDEEVNRDKKEEKEEDYEEVEVEYTESTTTTTTTKPSTTTYTSTTTEHKTQPTTSPTHYTTTKTVVYQTTQNVIYNENTSQDNKEVKQNADNATEQQEEKEEDDFEQKPEEEDEIDEGIHPTLSHTYYQNLGNQRDQISTILNSGIKAPMSSYGPPNHSTRIESTQSYNQDQPIINAQDFIYQHRPQNNQGHKPEAISFQQQSFPNHGQNSHITVTTHNIDHKSATGKNPTFVNNQSQADKVYITSTGSTVNHPNYNEHEQINKYEVYESSKNTPHTSMPSVHVNQPPQIQSVLTLPKPQSGPLQFSLRAPTNIPQGFKLPSIPTTQNPHSQIQSPNNKFNSPSPTKFGTLRPIQTYQPSEKHEVLYDHLSTDLPYNNYNQFHFGHKRSHLPETSSTSQQEVQSPKVSITTTTEESDWVPRRSLSKSPPRVIVSASASVSDSNGKKLNYTVGNVVHAVKPIVSVNYDDFKESDVILDPFFLDVPRLKKKRTKRSVKAKDVHVVTKRQTIINISDIIKTNVDSSKISSVINKSNNNNDKKNVDKEVINDETSTKWVPPDYVDDNYEPNTYKDPSNAYKTLQSYVVIDPPFELPVSAIKKNLQEAMIKKGNIENTVKVSISDETKQRISELNSDRKEESTAKCDEWGTESYRKISVTRPTAYVNLSKTAPTEKLNIINANKQTTTMRPLLTSLRPEINYRLLKVKTTVTSDSPNAKQLFSCKEKILYKFYPDPVDCRTFHLCSPGYNKVESLNMVFQCDTGMYFDTESLNCIVNKPKDCIA